MGSSGRSAFALLLCGSALLISLSVYAQPENATADSSLSRTLEFELERYSLPNGLRVVLNPNPDSPNVAVAVTYDVGSRNEKLGASGFAHLFEHMMFQGSRNVAKGDHFRLIAERGGKSNGTTNKDRTNYYNTVPAGHLPIALWLEADRMKSLALTRENFENQRAVVTEEFRMRYSGRAYALGYLRLHQLVFQGYWPYEHPTIGYLEDLDNAPFREVRRFHRAYYAPNNAVLSIAGRFDVGEAKRHIEQFFGKAHPEARLSGFSLPERMPRQTSERLSVMVDSSAKTPGVYFGYRIPPARTRAHRALELASFVLANGDSSRLYRSLVREKATALGVGAWTTSYRGPSALVIRIRIAPLSNIDTSQRWLEGELKRLRLIGPSASELSKAKAQIRQRFISSLQTNTRRAVKLGEFETFWEDASLLEDEFSAYDSITIAEIRQAASTYLRNTRRSIVEVYPPKWVRDIGPAIVTKTHIVKRGETLIGIARKFGTTARAIAKQNGISIKRRIVVGQRLLVTAGTGPRTVTKKHKVKKGETLGGIAHKHGLSSADIARANGISTKKAIQPGQELLIPLSKKKKKKAGSASKKKSTPEPAKPRVKVYVVRKGDTLSGIAKRHGISVKRISIDNNISRKRAIRPGQKLKLTLPTAGKKNKKKSR